MSERQQSPYDSIAGRWLALVERRQQNFIELCDSGRWRHYYTHAQLLAEMRKVLQLRNQWARLAGVPISEPADLERGIKQNGPAKRDASAPHPDQVSHSALGQRRQPASTILDAVAGRF